MSGYDSQIISMYKRAMWGYHRKYVVPGSAKPIFQVMFGVVAIGVLVEWRAHSARVREGGHH